MKVIFNCLISSTIFLSSLAFAEERSEIYYQTLKSCRTFIGSEQLNSFLVSTGENLSLLADAFKSNADLVQKISAYHQRKWMGIYVSDRMESDDFYQALRDCAPNSAFKRDAYAASLLAADSAGKLPAIMLIWIANNVSAKIFGGIMSLSKPVGVTLITGITLTQSLNLYYEVQTRYQLQRIESIEKLNSILNSSHVSEDTAEALVLESLLELRKALQEKRQSTPDPKIRTAIEKDLKSIEEKIKELSQQAGSL